MDITVDFERIENAGTQLTSLANQFPQGVSMTRDSSGSPQVDAALATYLNSLRDCCIGSAYALYGLGRGSIDAAAAFRAADTTLATES